MALPHRTVGLSAAPPVKLDALPLELSLDIADGLSPIDLLVLARADSRLKALATATKALRDRFEKAEWVQAAWGLLTIPRPGVADPCAALAAPGAIQSLARNLDCLTEKQRQSLVTAATTFTGEAARASAIVSLGRRLEVLTPAQRQGLVTAATALSGKASSMPPSASPARPPGHPPSRGWAGARKR